MRHFRRRGLACLFLFFLCGRAAAAEDASASVKAEELKKLQGTWVVVSVMMYGTESVSYVKGRKVAISGAQMTSSTEGEQGGVVRELNLDPTKKPKHIDMMGKFDTLHAVYALEGDRLTLSVNDMVRPTDFAHPIGGSNIVWIFKRK